MQTECERTTLAWDGDEDVEVVCRNHAKWRAGDFVFCDDCLFEELKVGSLRRVRIRPIVASNATNARRARDNMSTVSCLSRNLTVSIPCYAHGEEFVDVEVQAHPS